MVNRNQCMQQLKTIKTSTEPDTIKLRSFGEHTFMTVKIPGKTLQKRSDSKKSTEFFIPVKMQTEQKHLIPE